MLDHRLRDFVVFIAINPHSNYRFAQFVRLSDLPQDSLTRVRLFTDSNDNDGRLLDSFSALGLPFIIKQLFDRVIDELKLIGCPCLMA